MKSTEHFKNTIQVYLENRASYDELFAASFANPAKSIDECITYILNTVQKSGCNGFADEEILGYAVHYYDEIDIEVGKAVDYKVVVNHTIELTEEEKEQARKDAIKRLENEHIAKIKQQQEKAIARRAKIEVKPQATLFDF